VSLNPENGGLKVGKKRGRKKKEKLTKFVDDFEFVEQQVLNGKEEPLANFLRYQLVKFDILLLKETPTTSYQA